MDVWTPHFCHLDYSNIVRQYTSIVRNFRYLKPTSIVNCNIKISRNLQITCYRVSTFFAEKMVDSTDTVSALVPKKKAVSGVGPRCTKCGW